jgi:hypothetical protein
MFETLDRGLSFEDYPKHKPVLGMVKIEDFAEELAARYEKEQTVWCFHRHPVLADRAAPRQGLPHRCENRYNKRQIADQTLLYTATDLLKHLHPCARRGTKVLYFDRRPQSEVRAIHLIIQADELRRQVEVDGDAAVVAQAEHQLQTAVHVASDNGVSWQTIGDALGIRRGNAYQRFRRRRRPPRDDASRASSQSRDRR